MDQHFKTEKKNKCHLPVKINRYPLIYFENLVTSCITASHLPKSICVLCGHSMGFLSLPNIPSLITQQAIVYFSFRHWLPNQQSHCAEHSVSPLHFCKTASPQKFHLQTNGFTADCLPQVEIPHFAIRLFSSSLYLNCCPFRCREIRGKQNKTKNNTALLTLCFLF